MFLMDEMPSCNVLISLVKVFGMLLRKKELRWLDSQGVCGT
jgi:hypothetical protein